MSMVVQYRGGGRFSLRPGIQERGRLPSSLGIGGTGESFKGEHGLRVARGFISVLNAAKDDDRERVCSGVSVATSPAGEREKLRRRTKPGRARQLSNCPLLSGSPMRACFVSPAVSRSCRLVRSPGSAHACVGSPAAPQMASCFSSAAQVRESSGAREPQQAIRDAPEDSQGPWRRKNAPVRFFHRRRGPRGARQHRITRPLLTKNRN